MSRPFSARAKKLAEEKRLADVERRYLNHNLEAWDFCLKNGYRVYATCQYGTKVKLFKQMGEKFLPLSSKLYDQSEEQDVKEYVAAIDKEYERMYLLKKGPRVLKTE
jgi:hypothetical protein